MRDAGHGGGRRTGTARNLLIGHGRVDESSDLKSLAHCVKLVRRTEVAQEGGNLDGLSKSHERGDELVETSRRLRAVLGGNDAATGHANMVACYNTTMQVIPAIDLLGDYAVRLERGDYERVLFRQPIEEFMARIVATAPDLIHIVDLEGARSGELRSSVVRRCVEVADGIDLQVSGGIRSIERAHAALRAGATRVIMGTAVWTEPFALSTMVAALGEQLVVALDVRDDQVEVRGWQASTGLRVDEALERCVDAGVVRLHVTAIDRDGTMTGPDIALYERVCSSGIAVVAAGGVRNDLDVAALEAVGCEAAVMGLGYLERLGLDLDAE